MDLPEDAHRIAVANRIYRWIGRAVVAVTGLVLGAAIGSGLAWDQTDRLPDRARLAEIAALVYPAAPPYWIGGEDGPATVPHEDWPMERWWQKLLFGSTPQDGSAGADWPQSEIAANDEIAFQRLLDAEAALRADGWTIDDLGDALQNVDGTPTPDDVLFAHKGQIEIMLDSYGGERPTLSVYPWPNPTPAAPVLAGAAAGLALALTWMFARHRILRRKDASGGLGVAGAALLLPSVLLVIATAANEGAWGDGAPDLWELARFFAPIMPFGLFMNIGLALLLADLIRISRAPTPERALAA